jgi:hypothetical protein
MHEQMHVHTGCSVHYSLTAETFLTHLPSLTAETFLVHWDAPYADPAP